MDTYLDVDMIVSAGNITPDEQGGNYNHLSFLTQ